LHSEFNAMKPETLDRLLLSKSFLQAIRFQPVAVHDRHRLAANIIAAHDAAELTIAAICDQLGCLPQKGNSYLMDYFEPLKQSQHPATDVHAKDYFRNLNVTRNAIKHQGLFPDAKQWSRVGENVFSYLSKWVRMYLKASLAELDESALIADVNVKILFDEAKQYAQRGDYKGALEKLAFALSLVLSSNPSLRGFEAGAVKSEDAIRLSGFGVHGNDFLALQEFLPYINSWAPEGTPPKWEQSKYGHPGNWREHTVNFCLKTFVDVAIKIQGAQWIPGAVELKVLYEHQIEALKDGVEIWNNIPSFFNPSEPEKREVVKTLNKGETIKGTVGTETKQSALYGDRIKTDVLFIISDELDFYLGDEDVKKPKVPGVGRVFMSEVKVTCVPRQSEFMQQYFANLPVVDWEPETR
jgi:hypothetical protein